MWVITSLLEIEQLWNKASLFKSGVRVKFPGLLNPKTVESKACISFLVASQEAAGQIRKPMPG